VEFEKVSPVLISAYPLEKFQEAEWVEQVEQVWETARMKESL
jgi:hypothetical protein